MNDVGTHRDHLAGGCRLSIADTLTVDSGLYACFALRFVSVRTLDLSRLQPRVGVDQLGIRGSCRTSSA